MAMRPAIVKSNEDAAGVMRGRRLALGLPQEEVDHRVGWSEFYTCKAEAPGREYGRAVTAGSLAEWAQALGLAVVLMERTEAEALVAASTEPAVSLAHHNPHANRHRAREVVTRRVLVTRVRFTEAA